METELNDVKEQVREKVEANSLHAMKIIIFLPTQDNYYTLQI